MTTWSMRQALFCLIGSTVCTLALSLTGYSVWKGQRNKKLCREEYKVAAIVQTGPEKEVLKTAYLAELMGLSSDEPLSLYALDLKKAQEKLLASPLIQSAKLKRLPPNSVYVDYEVRQPIAWLSDYQNTAVDKDGYLFPAAPFLSPKEIPEIYLGLPAFGASEDKFGRKGGQWRAPLSDPYFAMAAEILHFLEGSQWKEGLHVKRIDVSNAFAPSLGQREVVLFTEEEIIIRQNEQEKICIFPKILRLSPKEYAQQLNNFFALKKTMLEDYRRQLAASQEGGRFAPRIIDLRIPQLAFVER